MIADSTPVLVGAAQLVLRDVDPADAPDPVSALARVARAAADDAEVGERALRELDTAAVAAPLGWHVSNPVRLLAEALRVRPARERMSVVGGETPLGMVNQLAEDITAGRSRIGLLAGVHLIRTKRRARKAGIALDWPDGGGPAPETVGEARSGSTELELAYGLAAPALVYPIFENALRAKRGLDFEAHRRRVGRLFSGFSEVASKNPHAWFPTARSADEITTPTPQNRMIAFPYTKYLNAVMETDQAVALLMMSAGAARSLGVPEGRWVHWWGGAVEHEDPWFATERPDFAHCPALRDCVEGALGRAGTTLGDVDTIDFYSCFPSAVEMACEMTGLDEDDPRGLTVTGGLPYAGGPGNNFTLHSLATTVTRLRERPGSVGLVTGNGWYLTKHSATVCASAPRPERELAAPAPRASSPAVEVVAEAAGRGTLETYTVAYDREGAPVRGIVVGRLADGRRFLANTPDDRTLLEDFARVENVGRAGDVSHADGRNRFEPR